MYFLCSLNFLTASTLHLIGAPVCPRFVVWKRFSHLVKDLVQAKPNHCNSLLAQSHNTPVLPPLPPPKKKILHNHCLQVLLGHEDVLREVKNNTYANFCGVKEVYYGICAGSELPFSSSVFPSFTHRLSTFSGVTHASYD